MSPNNPRIPRISPECPRIMVFYPNNTVRMTEWCTYDCVKGCSFTRTRTYAYARTRTRVTRVCALRAHARNTRARTRAYASLRNGVLRSRTHEQHKNKQGTIHAGVLIPLGHPNGFAKQNTNDVKNKLGTIHGSYFTKWCFCEAKTQ